MSPTQEVVTGDCVEVLPGVAAAGAQFDMVFADPPFNVKKKYGGRGGRGDSRADYYEWCALWIEMCFGLLKPTGTFYLMTIDRHLERLFPLMAARGRFINLVKWRNVAGAGDKRRFWNSTQPILVYGKTDAYKFNTYAQRRAIEAMNLRWGGYSSEPRGQLLDYWDDIPFVYAGGVAHPEAVLRPGTNSKLHPCQMPVALPRRAVLFSTDEGDDVLEPFAGLSATGVACAVERRGYLGVELSAEYSAVGRSLIERARGNPAEIIAALDAPTRYEPLFDAAEAAV